MTNTKTVAPKKVPDLPADLEAGLRRLKLAAVRRNAPEVLQVAKTQRWTPEEVLRTLVEVEIAAVPDERLATERDVLAPLPSLRPEIGAA